MEINRDLCIGLMPELRGLNLEIKELKGGITNQLYRIRSDDGQDYVFRFYGNKTELLIDRDVEMENLNRLQKTGVTPKVIKYLPDQRVTIVEFIPGYVLKNEDFLKKELWSFIIRPIKIIHQSRTMLPCIFDPFDEVKRFYKILEGFDVNYTEFDIQGTIDVLGKIAKIAAVSPCQYVPCHNDLLADNFIFTNGSQGLAEPMYLIDWEYGGMAPVYYDFADMFQEILLPKDVERELLMIYWEDRNIDFHEYMTDLFKPFPDIYWFLWSLIQLNISNISFDYYEYGKVKFENARKNIEYLKAHYKVRI